MRSLTFNIKLPLNIISPHAIFDRNIFESTTIVSTRYYICQFYSRSKIIYKRLNIEASQKRGHKLLLRRTRSTTTTPTTTTHNEKERINRRKGNIQPRNNERANSLHGKARRKIYIRPITRVTIERDIGAGEHGQRIKRALSHDPCIEQR